MSGPIWKVPLVVSPHPQSVNGRPLAACLDPDGVPCVWFVAGAASILDVLPTGAPAPMNADHLSTFVWDALVLHVWVRR